MISETIGRICTILMTSEIHTMADAERLADVLNNSTLNLRHDLCEIAENDVLSKNENHYVDYDMSYKQLKLNLDLTESLDGGLNVILSERLFWLMY